MTSTALVRVAAPVGVAFIAAVDVEPRIAAAHQELERLRGEIADARASAERLEAQVTVLVDPDTSQFVLLRLRSFLDELTVEAASDAEALARAVTGRSDRVGALDMTPGPLLSPMAPTSVAPAPVATVPASPSPVPPSPVPSVVPSPPTIVATDVVPGTPAGPGSSPTATPFETLAAAAGAPDIDLIAEAAADESGTAPNDDADAQFWNDPPPTSSRGHLFRVMRSVAFQAVALLLVLSVVLLRIG